MTVPYRLLGIAGTLKNAPEWASRPLNASPLRGKPVL